MKISPQTLARASSHHPWRTLLLWIVLVVMMGAISGRLLAGALTQDISFTNNPESIRAQKIIDSKLTEGKKPKSTEFFIIQSKSLTVDQAGFKSEVQKVQQQIKDQAAGILSSQPVSYYDLASAAPAQAAALVSANQKSTLLPVSVDSIETKDITKLRAIASQNQTGDFTIQVAGQGALGADFGKVAEDDLRKGESIGIAVALIVLIIVFAAVIAAVLPIVMAMFAITVALGIVALVGQAFDFAFFVTNMVTMIGLAVGIDYSLFIVSRYREERKKGREKLDAISATGGTANRAVFFSGMTVVLALLGMMIIPVTIFRSLAAGAIFVTIAALAASMTLLPAMLALLGDKINWPRLAKRAHLDSDHDPRGGFWDRLTQGVMTRPWLYLITSVIILGSLGSFYFQLHRGTSQTIEGLPNGFASKAAFLTLERDFSGGLTQPAQVIITGDVKSEPAQAAIKRLQDATAANPDFASKTNVIYSKDGRVAEVDAYFKGDPGANSSIPVIRAYRKATAPAAFTGVKDLKVLVGGNTAIFADFLAITDRYQWIVLGFVLGLSFILLTVVFRSIVLPLSAILMNLLSVGAAYGILTLVFQKGIGIGLFNHIGFQFARSQVIEAWLPLFLFSVLFGLSMDYQVFLLTRIREEYDKTGDTTEAVAYGLRTTAGIITGAALIMVAVFTGFASGRLGPLQQMGFGLGVAILVDATIVRTLLVPATMRILGDRNWYLPKWLEWLPKLNVEGSVAKPKAPKPKDKPPAPSRRTHQLG